MGEHLVPTFQKGDLVRLKPAGSPEMVVKVATDQAAICEWFDGTKHMQEQFDVALLVKADESKVSRGTKKLR
jgi:uncharacterized protein YodC (DUF2158 family)